MHIYASLSFNENQQLSAKKTFTDQCVTDSNGGTSLTHEAIEMFLWVQTFPDDLAAFVIYVIGMLHMQ